MHFVLKLFESELLSLSSRKVLAILAEQFKPWSARINDFQIFIYFENDYKLSDSFLLKTNSLSSFLGFWKNCAGILIENGFMSVKFPLWKPPSKKRWSSIKKWIYFDEALLNCPKIESFHRHDHFQVIPFHNVIGASPIWWIIGFAFLLFIIFADQILPEVNVLCWNGFSI